MNNRDEILLPNSFSELVKLQEGILMRLAAVAVRQLELVRTSDMTALLQLLGRKYQLLDEFEEIKKALNLQGNINPDERQWQNENEKINAKNSIEHCGKLLDEILSNDKQSIEEIELRRDELRNEICRFERISHTNLGYAKAAGKKIFVKHFDIKEK
ncbi:MAG: hypothetical protein LBP59_05345 [Planctomycetaceae bacterium]|jgi:hypothetical protein|nr:hypothetical protein [Planctomycetaceae bacterium]